MIPWSLKFWLEAKVMRALIIGAILVFEWILPSIFFKEFWNFLIYTNEGLVRVARRAKASSTEAVAPLSSSYWAS
jgi:hypothetical protein